MGGERRLKVEVLGETEGVSTEKVVARGSGRLILVVAWQ